MDNSSLEVFFSAMEAEKLFSGCDEIVVEMERDATNFKWPDFDETVFNFDDSFEFPEVELIYDERIENV